MNSTTAPIHLLTPTTLLLTLLLVAPLMLTSISPPQARLRRLGRAIAWLAGPILGVHLGYHLGTLIPSDISTPQPGMHFHALLLGICMAAGLLVGSAASLGLTHVVHDDAPQ